MRLTFKYRIYPTKLQGEFLDGQLKEAATISKANARRFRCHGEHTKASVNIGIDQCECKPCPRCKGQSGSHDGREECDLCDNTGADNADCGLHPMTGTNPADHTRDCMCPSCHAGEPEEQRCDCIDSDAWVCFRGQNIVGMDLCPCPCHEEAERLQETQRQIDQETHQWKFGESSVTCLRCGIQRTMKQAAEKCR